MRAERLGFELSCDETVGHLLAVLAAAVPPKARILELGTGSGVGLAWLVHGVGARSDVEVISVDTDAELHREVASSEWPRFVTLVLADGAEFVKTAGKFDLIFADAPGGKLENLAGTIEALNPGAVLIVDDMDLDRHDAVEEAELRSAVARVREQLLADPRLLTVDHLHRALGGVFERQKSWEKAARAFHAALALEPHDASTHFQLAQLERFWRKS